MRTALLFALLCTAAVCKAQDDVPDTRSKRDNLTKIQEKDIQADVAVFAMAGLEITMDKLPLKSLEETWLVGWSFVRGPLDASALRA